MQLMADGIIPWNQADFLVTMGISESEFDAILKNGEGVNSTGKREKLVINIRIVDRHSTHWEYKQFPGHFMHIT